MRELPAGTVTFLFTDIEGSTRLLRELGDGYADALAVHRRVLRDAFAAHDGFEIDTQGDAFFVAFARAADALAAARDGQAALAGGPIRVRMGIHTGEPTVTDEGYVGLEVHRAARIAASGHGGQVLVSQATRELLRDGLQELGEHRLKDFSEPIALFQVGKDSFPPLKTISNTNLPRPASSFVGRGREIEDVVEQLRNGTRFLTLTGPGGSGKTRLALEAAGELVPDFKAGVFRVPLASIGEATLVPGTIARTIGASDGLGDHIGERELLLLLDNLEQVVEAAPELASLVEACPNLRLLITSRERLRVRGEVEYGVEPLAEPEAVELFCARARTEADAAVPELCRALDNLPLALELAAARITLLSPAQILERLSERLDLFSGGRDADPRQQTLRATIEWSYDLLDVKEQRSFACLAVFSRGSTIAAAQDVAGTQLDTLQSLVDKGLVRRTAERLWMLETIREFAAERLRESGEFEQAASSHAEHFRALAERERPDLNGPHPGEAMARVEQDLENIRAAFRWNIEEGRLEPALAMFASLERFWSAHGCPEDFLATVDSALAGNGASVDEELRARALWVAGFQAVRAGETQRPFRLLSQSLVLFRNLGMGYETVRCLGELPCIEQERGREAEATDFAEQALAIANELDDFRAIGAASICLATVVYWRGDYARAADLYGEALRVQREGGADGGPIAANLYNIALCARALEDYERAESALREALEAARAADHAVLVGNAAIGLGYVMLARGDLDEAQQWLGQGMDVLTEIGNPGWTASALNLAAAIAAWGADEVTAAQLWGAADALVDDPSALEEADARVREEFQALARSKLGAFQFAGEVDKGRRMPLGEAIRAAKDTPPMAPAQTL